MKATGLFFLCGRPSLVRLNSPTDGEVRAWCFPLMERTRRGVQKVTAYWRGVDAAQFVQTHHERLKSGQALTLEVDGVRVSQANDLTAGVVTCVLAPDRWPKTEVDPTSAPVSPSPQIAQAS